MTKQHITVERLRDVLNYDPDTGVFTWKIRTANVTRIGANAGSLSTDNSGKTYLKITIDGSKYRAGRLAWAYVNNKWPANQIDHIDGNTLNNTPSNLRDVSQNINMHNQKGPHKNNRSGFLGVKKQGSKFQARIRVERQLIELGTFSTPELAHAAYLEAKRKHHAGCTI